MAAAAGRRPPVAWLALLAALAVASPSMAEISGSVVDRSGQPLSGARVCYLLEGEEEHCVVADEEGRFELPPSSIGEFRVVAEDYLPRVLPSRQQRRPIVLQRTPVLLARLLDASTGEPIGDGEVRVSYPTGESKGPFPASAAGVRISRLLSPGDILVVGSAEGYVDSKARSVTLRPGQESTVELRLRRAGQP